MILPQSLKQCLIYSVITVLFSICITWVITLYRDINVNTLTCRSEVIISKSNIVFKGLIDYKASSSKVIVNLTGSITDNQGRNVAIQRTALFSRSSYGISPVWESTETDEPDHDAFTNELMKKIIPRFYLQKSVVADVDLFVLSDNVILVTKSNLPYLYCKKYKL